MVDGIKELLQASLQEQVPVEVYFGQVKLRGVVTRVEPFFIEIRHENRRTAIDLRQIIAVTQE